MSTLCLRTYCQAISTDKVRVTVKVVGSAYQRKFAGAKCQQTDECGCSLEPVHIVHNVHTYLFTIATQP